MRPAVRLALRKAEFLDDWFTVDWFIVEDPPATDNLARKVGHASFGGRHHEMLTIAHAIETRGTAHDFQHCAVDATGPVVRLWNPCDPQQDLEVSRAEADYLAHQIRLRLRFRSPREESAQQPTQVVAERPDWVKCALTGRHTHVVPVDDPSAAPIRTETKEQRTWCGRTPPDHEWVFEDASHAALNGAQGGRLVLCPGCCTAIVRVLWNGLPEGGVRQ